MKKLVLIALFTAVFGVAAFAQAQPSTANRPYVVKSKVEVDAIQSALHSIDPEIKTKDVVSKTEDVMPAAGLQMRVAIQYDAKKNKAQAEVHDASDDVYYVLEGSAELTLGGTLENPKESSPGEWKSDKIIGGKTFTIKKGDLIVVPRGTPHQRINSKGKKFTLLLIKIWKDPQPEKK